MSNKKRRGTKESTDLEITVEVKEQYGTRRFYPICEIAKILALITKDITLTPRNLNLIQKMGYKINVEHPDIGINLK